MSRIAVLGLGLIGGSVAQGLARRHDVVGHDSLPAVCRTAAASAQAAGGASLRIVDAVAEAVEGADVVVLAGPVPANSDLLAQVPDTAIVTDVGSVKQPIVDAWQQQRLVPGHPMAGAETAGWDAASPDLFHRARWALCPGPWASRDDWLAVCALALELGAVIIPADPKEHDAAAARISHAPHVVAAALAAASARGDHPALTRALAAGSFRDLTRITGSPPERTAEFVHANAGPTAAVLRELAAAIEGVADRDRLLALLRSGHDARERVDAAQRRGPQASLTLGSDSNWWEPLLDLGRQGGLIHAISGATLTVTTPED